MGLDLRVMSVRSPAKGRLLPGLLPFVVGAVFYVSTAIKLLPEIWRLPVFILFFLLTLGLTSLMTVLPTVRPPKEVERWRITAAPLLFIFGTFLSYILISSSIARFLVVTGVMLMLLIFVMRLDMVELMEPVYEVNSVVRLGRLLSLIGIFSASVFLFALDRFVNRPMLLAVTVLVVLLTVLYYEFLFQSGVDRTLRIKATLALVVLGIEVFIGLSFLPTSYLANAAVLTVVCFTIGRSAVRILSGDVGTRGLKFGLLLAGAITLLVLATARWI